MVLEAIVDKSGEIETVRVVDGIPSLTKTAERSLQAWKFEPARIGGKPVVAAIVTAFSFTRYGQLNSSVWKAGEPGPLEKKQSLSNPLGKFPPHRLGIPRRHGHWNRNTKGHRGQVRRD